MADQSTSAYDLLTAQLKRMQSGQGTPNPGLYVYALQHANDPDVRTAQAAKAVLAAMSGSMGPDPTASGQAGIPGGQVDPRLAALSLIANGNNPLMNSSLLGANPQADPGSRGITGAGSTSGFNAANLSNPAVQAVAPGPPTNTHNYLPTNDYPPLPRSDMPEPARGEGAGRGGKGSGNRLDSLAQLLTKIGNQGYTEQAQYGLNAANQARDLNGDGTIGQDEVLQAAGQMGGTVNSTSDAFPGWMANSPYAHTLITGGSQVPDAPDAFLNAYLNASGIGENQTYLYGDDAESAAPILSLMNPGVNMSPSQQADLFGQLMGSIGGGQLPDAGMLWDKMFTDPAWMGAQNQGEFSNPGQQEQVILNSLKAMAPYLTHDSLANLAAMVQSSFNDYMNSGDTEGFYSYLQNTGAADWL